MKLKKILSGFLAAAMAVTSTAVMSFTASADTANGTHTFTNPDTFFYTDEVNKFDYKEYSLSQAQIGTAINHPGAFVNSVASITVNYEASDDISGIIIAHGSDEANGWWVEESVSISQGSNSVTTAKPIKVDNGAVDFQIKTANPGTDLIGKNLKINSVTFTGVEYVSEKIDAANFTYSTLNNTSMAVGDTFTITYDSDNTPDTAKHAIKYEVTNTDTNQTDYYTAVADDGSIPTDGEEATGLKVTKATSGKVTTYTFTAVAASKYEFWVKIEVTATGNWNETDTKYLWFDGLNTFKVLAATHTITIAIEPSMTNGTVTADKTEAAKDDTVTLTVTPDTGFELDTLTVTPTVTVTDDAANANKKTFTMPDEDVTVTATFKLKEVALTGITLDKQTASLLVGATTKLTATKTPANTTDTTAITWESDKTDIATVAADGTVTAKAAGTATITATCGEKTATCAVTVTADAKPCTGITLDETAEVTKGKTVTLTATPAPADTTDEITWKSSDEAVATVADGVVTGVARGTAKITATCGEKTAICEVSVTEDKTVTPPVSVGGQKSYDVVTTAADGTKVKTVDTVYSITEADLQCKGYEVTITNGSNGKSITKTITNAYKSVTVKSAEDLGNDTFTGYFLVVRVKNVPENVTLSYSFKKIS